MSSIERRAGGIIFFEYYKIIENIHSIGSWFCIYHQYSDCQLIKNFIKGQKKYCYICQFQDLLNLWKLDKIKREVNKLKKLLHGHNGCSLWN